MYQVLYRKFRPKTFSDVSGQAHVTKTLKNEIISNRLAHAYLFTGSRGTGKTSCAKILAKAVNCLRPDDGDPCCECEICLGIENGSIMDVVEIDAASNNGVDNIRTLREEANFTPAAGKYRVYIIDEVHMLSVGAFNALLKTLEEPPEHVLFILATTEVHKLPATVLSRCQRFDFKRIDDEDIKQRLLYVAEQEGVSLTEDAALLIARLADGGLRDALSLLDQCVGVSREVDADTVNRVSGLSGRQYLMDITEAVIQKNCAKALETVDTLYKNGADMERLCEELISHFRNLMILKATDRAGAFLTASKEDTERMAEAASALSLDRILSALDLMQETLTKLHFGLSRRVEMELALISLCTAPAPSGGGASEAVPAQLLERLQALETALKNRPAAGPDKPSVPKQKPMVKEPAEEEPPKPEAPLLPEGKLSGWPEIVSDIKKEYIPLGVSLKDSVAYVSGNYILIDVPDYDYFKELMEHKDNKDKLRKVVEAHTGRRYNLGPYKKEETAEEAQSPLQQLAEEARSAGVDVEIT